MQLSRHSQLSLAVTFMATSLCYNFQECSGFLTLINHHHKMTEIPSSSSSTILNEAYGKNAEIWPETNEDPVQLKDSFPKGAIPYSAIQMIERQDMDVYHENTEESISGDNIDQAENQKQQYGRKRQFVSRGIKRILRRAAAKEELDSVEPELSNGLDKTPILVAAALLGRGLVMPLDVALVSFLTAYGIILGQVARQPRETSGAPILPAMPPQGHVPTMVSNPLGMGIMYSRLYDLWLKTGVLIGLVGPVVQIMYYLFGSKTSNMIAAARIVSPPIFLLCCQAISEAFSRKIMAPLPLRILVPVAYNTARLPYLWRWMMAGSSSLGIYGQALGIANGIYWSINLFAFLIPVAIIRYMRAHFFCVEASEVTTRIGMEESVGLIPNQ